MPSNYGRIPKPKPQLGPPLQGDLGPGIVQREQQLGLNPAAANSDDEAERAEQERLAQQAEQAREAGVFFQMNQNPANGGMPMAGLTGGASGAGTGTTASAPAATSSGGADASHLSLNLSSNQNDQQRKLNFVNQASAKDIYTLTP